MNGRTQSLDMFSHGDDDEPEEDDRMQHFDANQLLEIEPPRTRLSWTFPTTYEVSFIAQPDPPDEDEPEVVRSRARTVPVSRKKIPEEHYDKVPSSSTRGGVEDFVVKYLREQKKEKLARLLESSESRSREKGSANRVAEEHPLETEWTFWFDSNQRPHEVPFNDSIEELGSFRSIEGFWSFWSHLKVGQLKDNCNLRLFRRGTKPLWEDPMNRNGGRWVARNMPSSERPRLWSYIVMAIIGENLETAREAGSLESVCGVVLSTREGGDNVQLWTDGGYMYKEQCRAKGVTARPIQLGHEALIQRLHEILFPERAREPHTFQYQPQFRAAAVYAQRKTHPMPIARSNSTEFDSFGTVIKRQPAPYVTLRDRPPQPSYGHHHFHHGPSTDSSPASCPVVPSPNSAHHTSSPMMLPHSAASRGIMIPQNHHNTNAHHQTGHAHFSSSMPQMIGHHPQHPHHAPSSSSTSPPLNLGPVPPYGPRGYGPGLPPHFPSYSSPQPAYGQKNARLPQHAIVIQPHHGAMHGQQHTFTPPFGPVGAAARPMAAPPRTSPGMGPPPSPGFSYSSSPPSNGPAAGNQGANRSTRDTTIVRDEDYMINKTKQVRALLEDAEANPGKYTKREVRNWRRQLTMLERRQANKDQQGGVDGVGSPCEDDDDGGASPSQQPAAAPNDVNNTSTNSSASSSSSSVDGATTAMSEMRLNSSSNASTTLVGFSLNSGVSSSSSASAPASAAALPPVPGASAPPVVNSSGGGGGAARPFFDLL